MDETDIYLHTSHFEPFGIPPIDAMKRGKLVIVSDGVKSVDKLIINNYNGYLFKSKDSYNLYQTLISVIQNKDQLYELGERGKKDANDMYNTEIYLNSIKEIIHA
jgi:glycosyltransferase involved in cell wall biosynthesis